MTKHLLQSIKKEIVEVKGEDGLRLNNYKEGHKDGFNKGIDHSLAIIDKYIKEYE